MTERTPRPGAQFINNGTFYLKHLDLVQDANVAGEGYIIIGHSARIFFGANCEAPKQQLHFVDGTAALLVEDGLNGLVERFCITNSPKDAKVQVSALILKWRLEGSDVILTDVESRDNYKITFSGYTLEKSKVVVLGNQLTYVEDLVTHFPDHPCAKMYLTMKQADEYEIPSIAPELSG